MALDRQRILSELGSVMNQLKSADCGCMEKLFGQSGQAASPSPLPTCGGCQRNNCMGSCNPPKLYADTYNYLTDNLMQPAIKEVYDDLKSLTPDNTIANNPMANQMGLPNGLSAQGHLHGPHSKGIAKFHEMFPGVMKNLGGDLGFDPMAIAIQMNPANQQQAAVDSMKKMMQNNDINKVFDQSANPAARTGAKQSQIQNNEPPNPVQQSVPLQQTGNDIVQQNATSNNQIAYQNAANYNKTVNDNANVYRNTNAQLNSQIYTAGMLPEQIHQPGQQHYQEQNIIDPNTGSEMAPPTFSSAYDATPIQRVIKEPIFPVDTSNYVAPKQQKYFEFNTLGQPVEKTSAEMYRTPEPTLPQTLSPQATPKPRADAAKYAKVKSTVSKTSLMGAKAVGRTPSQLQHIYNQYKGSQSFTQQNIAAQGVNAVTHSEGKLTAPQVNQQQRQMAVERVGGDTVANNQMGGDQRTVKDERVTGQIGDVPSAVKPIGDGKPNEMAPLINRNTRNGLQDMVYTSYPSSAAWTFHGANSRPYSPTRGRYRGRYR